jgi:hypothetical protein
MRFRIAAANRRGSAVGANAQEQWPEPRDRSAGLSKQREKKSARSHKQKRRLPEGKRRSV